MYLTSLVRTEIFQQLLAGFKLGLLPYQIYAIRISRPKELPITLS